MAKKDNTIIWLGVAAVVGYLLYKKNALTLMQGSAGAPGAAPVAALPSPTTVQQNIQSIAPVNTPAQSVASGYDTLPLSSSLNLF